MRYSNPVIPGFHPDPSICRVGTDYYLVTSSFEYFPGVPLFYSKDLVHWRQLGHCLTRPSQLPLQQAGASRGIFAPTLRFHAGRFYLITTNVGQGGNFIVHTEDPAGPWSDPVWIDQGGIDPSLCFDEDGSVYFTGTGITQFLIDPLTGAALSEKRQIWSGTGGQSPEAPHLYRINGVYYLMIAEGGTEYGHMVTMARSDSPWGPFEPCPRNPILSHRSIRSPLQCTGHADLVEDHTGNWWLVCLGVRPQGYPPAHHLGRETLLAPVTWDEDGWPVVGEEGRIPVDVDTDRLEPHPWPAAPERDDFDAATLRPEWNFLRNPYPDDWSLDEKPGCLRLKGSARTLEAEDSPAWVGRRQQQLHVTARTALHFRPRGENEEAGIAVYMNPQHYAVIARRGERIIVRRRIGSLVAETAAMPAPADALELAIEASPDRYRFLLGSTCLDEGETRYLSTEVAGGFTGVYFALYATGNGQPSTAPADFDWFACTPGNAGSHP